MGESSSGTIIAISCADPACPEPAQWRPVIHVFDESGSKVPGEVIIPNVTICTSHQEEAAKTIIESCWEEIVRAFAGWRRGKLDKARTKILFEAVDG